MSLRAVGLPRPPSSHLLEAVGVYFGRDFFHVEGIHAPRMSAGMVDLFSGRDFAAVMEFKRQHMHADIGLLPVPSAETYPTVALPPSQTKPRETPPRVCRTYEGEETVEEILRSWSLHSHGRTLASTVQRPFK